MNIDLRSKPWPEGQHARRNCPVCGEPWVPWAGSLLPCHAKCLFDDRESIAIFNDPRTEAELSRSLGVTTSVIRATRAKVRVRIAEIRGTA